MPRPWKSQGTTVSFSTSFFIPDFFFQFFLTLNSQDLAEVLQLTGCSVDEHFLQTCNGGEGTKKYLLCIFIAKNVPS